MKRKIKRVLLAMALCLGICLQSLGTVQAAVNYEVCPLCGTMVSRGERTKVISMTYLRECGEHERCDIYRVEYGSFGTITCQTSTCSNYNRDTNTLFRTWTSDNAHVTQ